MEAGWFNNVYSKLLLLTLCIKLTFQKSLSTSNSGKSTYTNKFTPWKIKNYIAFETQEKAEESEKFLKSGNGRAFCKKHF